MLAAIIAVSALRVYECTLLPIETGDVVRNLLYGIAVDVHGLSATGG